MGSLLPVALAARAAGFCRPRPFRPVRFSSPPIRSLAVASALLLIPSARAIAAPPPCSGSGDGWCLAHRFEGEVAGAELGFRFGEPLDMDGDGHADVAAGARFKLAEGSLQNGSVLVWSGKSGARLRAWDGTLANGLFGQWVLPVPDLDGDSLADLVIAAPNALTGGTLHGVLVARSPKSDQVLWTKTADREENLGWDLAPAGDQNGDGIVDVFAGAPSSEGGRVVLVSGKDGSTLRTYSPPVAVESFGWFVAATDDVDGDHRADLLVGAFRGNNQRGSDGGAYLFSSSNGEMLQHWQGPPFPSGFGEVVASTGDFDGDGHGDVLVAAPRTADTSRALPGEIDIFSSATGRRLHHWGGKQNGELYGRMVASAGDVDGDGTDDIAIGAPWYRTGDADKTGRVEIRSGKTGDVLAEWFGDEADCWFGWHIRRAPDPDGKGRPALLIGSLRHPVGGKAGVGVIDLYVRRGAATKPAAPSPASTATTPRPKAP